MPLFADRIGRMSEEIEKMTTQGLRFSEDTAEAIGKAEARHTRSGRAALWVIAAALSAMALNFWM
jgi:ubiquinone biosynthesis protein